MADLEVAPSARVLEVSVGTGGNVPYVRDDAEIFGLDLSWGMLQRCQRNLNHWRRRAELFQCEAETLPFRGETFDVVYHVGGINFFNDKSRAIAEMIRVARPGTKIMIVDETEKVIREEYRRNPLTRAYYKGGENAAICPIDLVPPEMLETQARLIVGGRMYCLTFRKP
jgi:ubiquinone/menaquinone biosynthesis C-methylase UbiE